MKLRKAIKVALAGAAVAPVVAMAGLPGTATFGNWTPTASGITATCPSGFTCTAGTTEGDASEQFLQRQLTDGSGNTFIQTIVTGDTGEVSDESFVKIGGSGGVADRATITSTEGGTSFDSTSSILTGEFFSGTDKGLEFTQNLAFSHSTSSTFTAGFHYQEQDAAATIGGSITTGLRAETTLTGFVSDADGMDATFTMTEIEAIEQVASQTAAAAAEYSKGLYVANNIDDSASTEPMTQNFLIREAEGPNMITTATTLSGSLNGGNSFTVAAGGAFESMQMTQTVAGGSYATEQFFNTGGGTGSVDTDNFGGETAGITINPDPF